MNPALRVLIAGFVNSDHPGVLRKMHEQVAAMKMVLPNTVGLVIGDNSRGSDVTGQSFTFLTLPGGAYHPVTRATAFHLLWEATEKLSPDVVYLRFPHYDSHVLRFVRDVPHTVFEIQTKVGEEFAAPQAAADGAFARRILPKCAGIVAVTEEILHYELTRAGSSVPAHVMTNGVDPATIPMVQSELKKDRIEMLCVANFAQWHGIDRILAGMAISANAANMHLHLVGTGQTTEQLREFVRDFGLAEHVTFHGALNIDQMTPLFERASFALGPLATHRKGLLEHCALKHREYCMRGVPFVFAGNDPDFPANLPFVEQLPLDDSPIMPEQLQVIAARFGALAGGRASIRQHGMEHVSWRVKTRGLAEFLSSTTTASSGLRRSA